MNQRILSFGILALVSCVNLGMEKKRKESTIPAKITKHIKYEDLSTVEQLPRELQIKILVEIINSAQNVREAITELHKIMILSKSFYLLINSPDANTKLIEALARRFFHHDQMPAAELLDTKAARDWITHLIPNDIKKKIIELIATNIVRINNGDMSSLTDYLKSDYETTDITIKQKFFNTVPTLIWLFKTILQQTAFRRFSLINLIADFFPAGINNPVIDEWITYTDRQIKAKIPTLIINNDTTALQSLINAGVDISQNLGSGTPFLLMANDPKIIKLLIDSGANVNEQQISTGFTALHFMIKNDLHLKSMAEGKSLTNEKNVKALSLIKIFLEAGANPDIKNSNGQTVFDLINEIEEQLTLQGVTNDPFLSGLINLLKKYSSQIT